MRLTLLSTFLACIAFAFVGSSMAQDASDASDATDSQTSTESVADVGQEKIGEKIDEYADKVNENQAAQEATQSILKPIYEAAQYLSAPWFHWVAFALMVAGLVSFALQLVLGKLIMLLQFHFSLTEILADGLGFAISAIGLILTTQAATQNSSFPESPVMVLSATAVGVFFGLIFYVRGQTQEYREARELRRREDRKAD